MVCAMALSSHQTSFAGLPVVQWGADDDLPDDPAAVAWRLEVEDFEAPADELEDSFEELLKSTGEAGPAALIFGEWGSAYERAFPVDLLVRNAARLSSLRALFIADMTSEQCEISWI